MPDCIKHISHNVGCFLSEVLTFRKNVTFVLFESKEMSNSILGTTLMTLENFFFVIPNYPVGVS